MDLRLAAFAAVLVITLAVVQVTRAVHPRGLAPRETATLVASSPARADGGRRGVQGRGFGRSGVQEDLALVARFDANGDKRLNPAERRQAREYAESLGLSRGGRGGPRGRMSAPVEPGPTVNPASVRHVPASRHLYDPDTIRTLFLTFESADWERELMVFKATDVRVPATLVVDGQTYPDVGVQFHGNSSFRSVPEGLKHSMTLAIDFAHDQKLGGYRTLTLLNSHEDPSLLRAVLYLQIAREYLPAPKANFVHVVINGESWGIYPSVQHFNKDFTRDWFKSDEGARWKVPGSPGGNGGLQYIGDDVSSYKRTYEIKSADDPKAWRALMGFTRVLSETPTDQLATVLSGHLDVEGALRFLALDNALVNNDGYWTRASDYNIYLDALGKFHLVPYDVNETFPATRGMGGRGGNASLDPLVGLNDWSKPLRSKLLAVPAFRAKYLQSVRSIATHLDWQTLGPVVARYQALLRPYVATDTRKLDSLEAFDESAAALKSFADARRTMLLSSTVQ